MGDTSPPPSSRCIPPRYPFVGEGKEVTPNHHLKRCFVIVVVVVVVVVHIWTRVKKIITTAEVDCMYFGVFVVKTVLNNF